MGVALSIAASVVLAPAAAADSPLAASRWLAPDAGPEALTSQPREVLTALPAEGRAQFLVGLGRLAFRSPAVFGGWVGREGLSCQSCHSGGATNVRFFVRQASDRPGNVDVSHDFWAPVGDDGRTNAVNIPSLRGIVATAPYGRDGRHPTLADVTRSVIVTEFAGPEPDSLLIDALVAYQAALAFPTNHRLAADGRLAATASEAARRGQARFARDCAGCHPTARFADGRNHDVGTGGSFETPTLRGLAETAPYFHDGRAADLKTVVDHFDRALNLNYDPTTQNEVVAYLETVGAVEDGLEPLTLQGAIADIRAFAALLKTPLAAGNGELVDWISGLVRRQIGAIDERFHRTEHAPAREVLVGWSRRLAAIATSAARGRFAEAQGLLGDWDNAVERERAALSRHEPSSLYRREEIVKLK